MKSTNYINFVFAYKEGEREFFRVVANTDLPHINVFTNTEGGIVEKGCKISDNVWIDKDSNVTGGANITCINHDYYTVIENSYITGNGYIGGRCTIKNSKIEGNYTITHCNISDSIIVYGFSGMKSTIKSSQIYGSFFISDSYAENIFSDHTNACVINKCNVLNMLFGNGTKVLDNVTLDQVNVIGSAVTFRSGLIYQGDSHIKTTVRCDDAEFSGKKSVFEIKQVPDDYGKLTFFYDSFFNKVHVIEDSYVNYSHKRFRETHRSKLHRMGLKMALRKFGYYKECRRRLWKSIKEFFTF